MSRRDTGAPKLDVSDSVGAILDSISRFLISVGGLLAIGGVGLLLWIVFTGGNATGEQLENILGYIGYFRQAALWGMLATCLGVAWLMWGEETAGPIMLIVGFALVFANMYVPVSSSQNELPQQALQYATVAGYPAVIIGFLMIIGDVIGRIKFSVTHGAKSEQMKYGKNVKEERDVRNVFLGKCWQLPYCRKFVRERCPIYHARRTCWKERVGCMCEEAVIKNAMENKSIPKDIVAAAKFIPRNNKLTPQQKAERCNQCVIYNEHQKHKYKLFLPVTALSIAGIYVALRVPMGNAIKDVLRKADTVVTDVGLTQEVATAEGVEATGLDGGIPFHEIILVVITLVVMAYAIKVLEHVFFRMKS